MTPAIPAKVYAGFFAIDTRLLLAVTVTAVLCSLGTIVALRQWSGARQYALAFAAFFAGYFLLACLILDVGAGYPVFVLRSFFEVP